MSDGKNRCPECESEEFISEPNKYDILEFQDDDFIATDSKFLDEHKIFCRECSEEVDIGLSIQNRKVMLKNE